MSIIVLKDLLRFKMDQRIKLNNDASELWDTQPCGMEVVSGKNQVEKIDSLMALRQIDCPEIYQYLRTMSLENKMVLELGCGTGIDSRELIQKGSKLTSVDFSKASLHLAKEFLQEVFPGKELSLIHASSHATNLPDEHFDIIYSHGSIHHSPLFPEICKEINRMLKPGGKALIMVYRKPSLMYLHAKLGRLIDYNAPVSLFLSDAELRKAMSPLKEVWRKNYYFARPHVTRIGKYIPAFMERLLGRFFGACQLVEFKKLDA
ncbi:class I SAM-dependent methyltransferase [Legionella dresdenensis]|uniref:Class I SAM-dependent methyltransferase n=1 Tax=Legionella dresdenensis TaxID=450200 RepID=A0ABV8CDX0_9GAMM